MSFVKVASLADLPDEGLLGVEAGGRRVCLARLGERVYAFEDRCSHRDFPLSSGELDPDECTIECAWHGAAFDLETGDALTLPATRPVPVYDCRVEGDDVLVRVPA